MNKMSDEDRMHYIQAILWDPDLPRFYSDERIAELEMELEELRTKTRETP
jgi:hypothetical protein